MEGPPVPEPVRAVLARLADAGIDAYLVGGALRDWLCGREVRDWDALVCVALEEVRRILPDAIPIDSQNPVLLVRGEPRLEITTLRGGASRLDEDLALRDFTLNAIAWDPLRARWIDPQRGREDLAARRLVACCPERAFVDDPVRIVRGVRLAGELALRIDAGTRLAMERHAWRLVSQAGERLRAELWRTLRLTDPTGPIEALRQTGALCGLLPELLRGVGVGQNRVHPEDVYRHSLSVCAGLPPRPLLRLAGLLHDVAKPETKGFGGRSGDISFHRHERKARAHLIRIAGRLRLSRSERDALERLVRHHLLFEEQLQTDSSIRRMLRRVGADILEDLLELRRADLRSRGPLPETWLLCEARIRAEANKQEGVTLAIDGEDVMRELGIEPGPGVGRWLSRARRYVLEQPEANVREQLIAWLQAQAREG